MSSNSDSPDRIEYIRTEGEFKDWTSEEVQELNSSLKICCIPLPRRLYLLFKYLAPTFIFLVSFVADIYSDVAVAVRHYSDGHFWWFGWTVLFIVAPAVVFIIHAVFQLLRNKKVDLPRKLLWIVLYIFTGAGFLLWPLWSYFKRLYYIVQALFDKERSIEHLEKFHSAGEGKDNLQKLVKAFLQSAPQLLLQLYILLSVPKSLDIHTVIAQVVAIFFSLNTMTVVVVHFEVNSKHHPSRASDVHQKQEVGDLCCVIIEYLWWFCSITSRIIALAFFASVFKYWVILICAIHAFTISACLYFTPTNYSWNNLIVSFFMGIIYIFCFIEYRVDFGMLGRVVGLYILYYGFTFCQNVCMVLSAYFLAGESSYWYHLPLTVSHFVLFFLAVMFMLFYLGLLRPFYLRFIRNRGRSSVG